MIEMVYRNKIGKTVFVGFTNDEALLDFHSKQQEECETGDDGNLYPLIDLEVEVYRDLHGNVINIGPWSGSAPPPLETIVKKETIKILSDGGRQACSFTSPADKSLVS